MKRYIRLKEWEPNAEMEMSPSTSVLETSDGSLSPETVKITVSNDGFIINPERDVEYDTRIIVMGDSVVDNLFSPQGSRFTDIIEKELRLQGVSARVENGGRSGATILQLLLSLQAKIIPLAPDMIVLMNGVIDADALQVSSGLWSKGDYINPIEEEKTGHDRPTRLNDLDFSSRTKCLRLFSETCSLFGIELILATTPLRGDDEFSKLYNQKNSNRKLRLSSVNDNTREFCHNNSVKLCDLDNLMGRPTDCFYDYLHFNNQGALIAGKALADVMMTEFFSIKMR